MAKPTAGRPLARILATDTQLSAWLDRMQRESQLTTAVRRMLPRALADRVRVAEAAPPALTLAVAAGALAAVIRQRSPDILAGLRREGMDFSELKVRVQVSRDLRPHDKKPENQRLRVNSAPLKSLAAHLPKGALQDAVLRLMRRAG